jgi:hypothetical protein
MLQDICVFFGVRFLIVGRADWPLEDPDVSVESAAG